MKLFLTFLISLSFSIVAVEARACSIAIGFETRIESWKSPSGELPDAPNIEIREFFRGEYGEDSRPCGYLAYLELRLIGPIDEDIVGFHISIVESANAPFFIPSHLIYPRKSDDDIWSFWFSWPDLLPNNAQLPPVTLTLEISQVSESGAESKPRTVLVQHRGG